MKQVLYIVIGILVIAGGAGALYYINTIADSGTDIDPTLSIPPSPTSMRPPTDMPTNTPQPTDSSATDSAVSVPDTWEQYQSDTHGITLSYPPEAELQEGRGQDGQRVRILYTGPDQPEGTELIDGYSVSFTSGAYETDSFDTFIKNEAEEIEQSPTVSSIQEVESYEHPVYENAQVIRAEGRPSRDYIYFPDPTTETGYLQMIQIAAPPDEHEYGIEAGTIISTMIFIDS